MLRVTHIVLFGILLIFKYVNCEFYTFNSTRYNASVVPITLTNLMVFWPNATVPFHIFREHFDRDQEVSILNALHTFSYMTCLKFEPVPTTPVGEHVMMFQNPQGVRRCTISPWGHSVDEPHRVTLGYDCLKTPNLEMMIMKALGFPFEHNRANRDRYVDVQGENIEQGFMEHFAKDPKLPPEMRNLQYDYDSVMHFDRYAYSKNGHKTIVFKDKTCDQKRSGLSPTDLRKIEIVYGPECRKRERQEKIELCQGYPGSSRKKRSIYAFPRKSLRVNPDITPPPMLDSAELDNLNISDVVKEITEHVQVVSGLIVKVARVKFCNLSKDDLPADYSDNEKMKEAISKIENHAKSVINYAQSHTEEFCANKTTIRTCGDGWAPGCTPGYKSTKSGKVIYSTQYKYISQSTNIDRQKDRNRLFHPYPMGMREGNALANETLNKTNETEAKSRKKREDSGILGNIEEKNEILAPLPMNDETTPLPEPSRRLVRKFRTKPTFDLPSRYTTSKTTEAGLSIEDDGPRPKADENDYEEIEEIIEEEIPTTKRAQVKATPPHQKRFKKKYVDRQSTENKEEDTVDFSQHQGPKHSVKEQRIPNKPNQGSNYKKIAKTVREKKIVKTTPAPKNEIQNVKYENEDTEEDIEEDDEAAGVKNVKVIMEYNTASPAKFYTPVRYEPEREYEQPKQYSVGKQQIAERQDEDDDYSSDANEGVELEAQVETQEEPIEDEDSDSNQPPVIIPENQVNTPSPEIFVNQFQPDPMMPPKKKHKYKKESQSADEEDNGMNIDEVRPTPSRKPPKIKKQKTIKLPKPKTPKPPKTRIIGPGAPSYDYQVPPPMPNLPRTIRLNKKNLEFYNERKWNDAIIPYVISEYKQYNTNDLRRRLNEVIKILKKKTCVRLQEISMKDAEESVEDFLVLDTSPDYVTGKVGGKQHFGSVELFEGGQHRQHAAMMIMAMLGFYFEVARHDRDKYVRVHLRHVRADKLHHFEKIRDDATFPLPYDYKSATHPAWQFWRKLGKRGISTVATYKESDPSGVLMKTLGQNPELLSEYDIIKINTIYGVECFMKSGLIRDV